MFNHILLEVYCTKNYDENIGKDTPEFCCSNELTPRYDCLFNKCLFVSFTSHENALCYVNEKSEAEKIIVLSEEDNLQLWKEISIKKINEAYDCYMKANE